MTGESKDAITMKMGESKRNSRVFPIETNGTEVNQRKESNDISKASFNNAFEDDSATNL